MKLRLFFLVVTWAAVLRGTCHAQLPAFSGAEGPGAMASGGRGGDVYHVTNLEFDKDGVIPGSLRHGLNTAPSDGRTIVFDVGGTIFQNGGGPNHWLRVSKDNITVAGQTAPGPAPEHASAEGSPGPSQRLRGVPNRTARRSA